MNQEPYAFKADCWAFGCILYAMLTGSPPFEVIIKLGVSDFFKGKGVPETLNKVKKGVFDMPKNISKNLKDLISNLITWVYIESLFLISKDPAQRYDMAKVINHPFFHEIITPAPQLNSSFDNHEPMNNSMSFGEGLQGRKNENSKVIKENFNILNSHQTPVTGKTAPKTVRSDSRTPNERKLPPMRRASVGSANTSAVKENKENQEILSNLNPQAFKRDPTRAPTGKHSRNNSMERLEKMLERTENHPTPPIIKAKPKELVNSN